MAIPYGLIARLLREGQVVPFLGAGVNFGARQPKQRWDESQSEFLPTGPELSRLLAKESGFTSRYEHDLDDLAKVASYYVENSARIRLRQRLAEIFKPEHRVFQPCSIHQYLAAVAARKPLLIVTTNFDDLIERALEEKTVPFDLVIHPADHHEASASVLCWRHDVTEPAAVPSNQLHLDLNERTVVYKIHGTIGRKDDIGGYVITEEDYEDFLLVMTSNQMVPPPLFMEHFHSRHFLFLGYSLRDWNLRVILRNLKTILPPAMKDEKTKAPDKARERERLMSWSIQFEPLDWERELWETRGVKIYDIDINKFVKELSEY
jgi:SIR2-like domain